MKYKIILSAIFVMTVFSFQSCYYDNEELLYNNVCDTASMSYANNIKKIITDNCYSCHSGAAPTGGFSLESFTEVQTRSLNGSISSSLIGANNFSLMPTSGKLSDCDINKINAWIHAGAPDN